MKHAWIDDRGVLIGWGYSEDHMNLVCVPVPAEFDLQPLHWRLINGDWMPYEPTATKLKRWFTWRK